MPDEPAYILDLSADAAAAAEGGLASEHAAQETAGRPWIGIHFECCGIYNRIYRSPDGTAYEGYCPRCARPVRVKVGEGGTSHRMFRAQ